MKRDTRLIHSGQPRRNDDLVNPPIERASTVVAPTTAELYNPTPPRRHYGRGGLSPNMELREAIGELYGADHVSLAQSGLASVILALRTALPENPAGMQALITDSAYGPVRRFCDEELPRYGVTPVYYDPRIGAGVAELLDKPTAVVLLESPGSLTFEVQDIPAIAGAARKAGVATVIDDTWSAGVLMNPLELGVDYAAQALTKYAGGHSDFLMGSVAARGESAARLKDKDVLFGGHVSPDDAYLCLRGLRTLLLRIERSGASGLHIARQLEAHPKIARVLHPGLQSHPDHALFNSQFTGASGCFAFVLDGVNARDSEAMAEACHLFRLGFSWGGYESLILPCDRQIRRTAVAWQAEGALLRLSVGLEDAEDLWADLAQALG
ncbi:cystathionine beta-lyase [Oceanicaulis sp. HTCC2633]|uniref:cystathionine beta-lyase n=1 Tax=Oceanicaulis sp. HTCC2633 TaxID=314254 RepID=UPI000066D630|nr:cystathionine beta-lyase [Oceanicaulis sp. HTCC2633]EAP90939.1 cystathionine beta-lyase [Oceanicaulis sp. HTCC2633]